MDKNVAPDDPAVFLRFFFEILPPTGAEHRTRRVEVLFLMNQTGQKSVILGEMDRDFLLTQDAERTS